jgi:Glucosamine 6-phosphate synthetase, contains amidotransferase and phosphosugar isomerase domains
MEQKPTMLSYIKEQQKVLTNILEQYPKNVADVVRILPEQLDEILFLGTGSSINAAYSAKYYIEKLAKTRVSIQEPFNYYHYETISPHISAVFGISQSGQSTSTITALNKITQTLNIPTVAVTSDKTSELTKCATQTLDILSGKERVGYVTLGFTSTVLSLMLFGLHFAKNKGLISVEQERKELAGFQNIISHFDLTIDKSIAFFNLHEVDFAATTRFMSIAYGPLVGTAKEMETKFSETIRVPSQGIELEAFMHGPYLEINPEHRLFFIETNNHLLETALKLKTYEQRHTKYVYTLNASNSEDKNTLALAIEIDEWKAPLLFIVPFQVFCWYISYAKGIDITKRIYTDFSQAVNSKTTVQDYV